MKIIKWKIILITCAVCLLPILLGLALWNELPESIAIHFNIYGEPDNFASKGFAVIGLPLLMVPLQIICCLINDFNSYKHGARKKFEMITKWILPVLTTALYIVTIGFSLGWNIDITKTVALIIGVMFLVIGNYLPKFDYIKDYNVDTEKAKKINRFIGFETVFMGILSIITIFLPPISLLVWLFLLIPYAVVGVVYGIKVCRK